MDMRGMSTSYERNNDSRLDLLRGVLGQEKEDKVLLARLESIEKSIMKG